jgi:hypothetical protein
MFAGRNGQERKREERVEGAFIPPSHRKELLQLYDPECPGKSRKLWELRRL